MGNKIFKRGLAYNRRFINICIMRIRYGHRSERTIQGYKTFVFKSMKDIVEKNIKNYLNLLNGSPCRDTPEYDEIISECYIVFDKCIQKYKITKTNNFYFYFNKALSRYFFRCYQKELNFPQTELTEEISIVCPSLSEDSNIDTIDMLLNNLGLNDFEKSICYSRLNGEKGTEFIRKNEQYNQKQYSEALNHIKEILLQMIKDEKFEVWLKILT